MLGRPLLFFSSYASAVRPSGHPVRTAMAVDLLPRAGRAWRRLAVAIAEAGRRFLAGNHVLASVQDAGVEAASYLAAYLLPFVTVATPTVRDVLAYGGFLLVAAAINIRSAVVQVNPLLYLLGYRVLSVTDNRGLHAYMITGTSSRQVTSASHPFQRRRAGGQDLIHSCGGD